MRPTLDLREVENSFRKVINDLQSLTGFDRKKLVLSEAGSVLKVAAGRTKVAKDLERVDVSSRVTALRALGLTKGDITINAGRRGPAGRVWVKTGGWDAGKRGRFRMSHQNGYPVGQPNNYHWTNGTWTDIREAIQDYTREVGKQIARGRASIGLARQSFVQIADSLGIRLESVPGSGASPTAISKARAAIASNGRAYINGASQQGMEQGLFFVDLINTLPYGTSRKLRLDEVLAGAINGRVKFFETNLSTGVFDYQKQIAKKYPGFYVTRS